MVESHLRSPAGNIPIFVAASGERTLEATGEHADGVLLLAGLNPAAIGWALDHVEAGRARSSHESFETACCLYGAIDDDEAAAIDAARAIVAWLAVASPGAARIAGMSDDLIEQMTAVYSGREFQEAREAARLAPDELVQQVAFAGSRSHAEDKLAWLAAAGIDTINLGPLAADPRPTIAAVAEIAGLTSRSAG